MKSRIIHFVLAAFCTFSSAWVTANEAKPTAEEKKPDRFITTSTGEQLNLRDFECASDTRSSFLNQLCYDQQQKTAVVSMNETHHKHCQVPVHIIGSWILSDSMGRFYFNRVKGRFDCVDNES